MYFVASLWITSAFLFWLFGNFKSALVILRCFCFQVNKCLFSRKWQTTIWSRAVCSRRIFAIWLRKHKAKEYDDGFKNWTLKIKHQIAGHIKQHRTCCIEISILLCRMEKKKVYCVLANFKQVVRTSFSKLYCIRNSRWTW